MKRGRINIEQFIGYGKKDSTKLPDGIHQMVYNADVNRLSLSAAKDVSTPTIDGASFSDSGLSTLTEFFKFYTGQSDEVRYLARDGNKIMLWDSSSSSWSQVDSGLSNTLAQARFTERNGAVVIATGNAAANKPEWYGYYAEQFRNAFNGTLLTKTPIAAGYASALANIETPVFDDYVDSVASFTATSISTGYLAKEDAAGLFTYATIYYRIALQYDGSIWSMPSEIQSVTLASATAYNWNAIRFKIDPSTFSKRVTAIRIYAGRNMEYPYKFYRVAEITMNKGYLDGIPFEAEDSDAYYADYVLGLSGSYNNTSGLFTSFTDMTAYMSADMFNSCLALIKVSGAYTYAERILDTTVASTGEVTLRSGQGYQTISFPAQLTVVSGWWWDGTYYYYTHIDRIASELDELPEMWEDLGYGEGEDITANYKYAVIGAGRQFIAGVYKDETTYDSRVYFSAISNSGANAWDVFRDANYIDVNAIGISKVVGLGFEGNRLYVFGERGIAILSIGSGSIMTWTLYKLVQDVGIAAPDSIIQLPDGKYAGGFAFMSHSGPRVLYNGYSYPIGEIITDYDNFPLNVSDLSEAVSGYDVQNNSIVFSFPTDGVVYVYSSLFDSWQQKSYTNASVWFGQDDNNHLMLSDGSGLYSLSGDDLTAYVDTREFTTGNEIVIDKIGLRYSSAGTVTVTLTTDVASVARTFDASTSIDTPKFKPVPYGTRAERFYLRVSGFTQLSAIYIDYHEVKAR